MTSNVEIILGPPGTGKTYTLLEKINEYLEADVDPDRIGFISFTKKSVTEACERAAIKFNKPQTWFKYFRTIHSLSFRQLSLSPSQVMNKAHYLKLGDILGVKMTGIHRQDQLVYEMAKGDQMVFIESLARQKVEDMHKTWSDAQADMSFHEMKYFQESLIKYKRANLLYDFTDMLVRYEAEGYKPDLDVLFVDEAQDLCKLQWQIVSQMMAKSHNVYIAGDDDQAIYRWSGADVDYFLKLGTTFKTRVLTQSYRLPHAVYTISQSLTKQIKNRNVKEFKPTSAEGKVEWVSDMGLIDMSQGEWLILVRNGFLQYEIIADIRRQGYPYQTAYYTVQDDEGLKAAKLWEKLRTGGSLTLTDVKLVRSFISKSKRGASGFGHMDRDDTMNLNELIEMGSFKAGYGELIWHKALDLIPRNDRDYYIAVRRREESLTAVPRIKISTIHGAKGGEAENVVLWTDMSDKTWRNMNQNYDDELRVFYVGATRAKKNLFIIQPQTNKYFQI